MLEGISFRDIDINFDFTSDTPRYWDGFWEDDLVFGNLIMTLIQQVRL